MSNCIPKGFKDMFQTSSNDYVCPTFPTCANVTDDIYFEFLNNKNAGILSKMKTLMSFSLSDISIPIESYNQQSILLGPGQYQYISGGDRGCQKSYYVYHISDVMPLVEFKSVTLHMTIEYIDKFTRKPFTLNIELDKTFENSLDIINDEFKAKNIPVEISMYNNEGIKISHMYEGHYFDVKELYLNYIDFDDNTFMTVHLNFDAYNPPFRYINGAFKGILMTMEYPPDTKKFKMFDDEEFIYAKHVPNKITDYYADSNNSELYIKKEFLVDFSIFNVNTQLIQVEKENSILWDDGETGDIDESLFGNIIVYFDEGHTPDIDESLIRSKNTYNYEETIQYIDKNDLWDKTSHIYMNTGTTDNFLNGIILYNPHNFPVKINYLIFS